MDNNSLTLTISVNKPAQEVFEAITNVRGWWSEEIEGGTAKLNDEFFYHYEDVHRCHIKLIDVIPYRKIVWQVIENYFKFTADTTEWTGTHIIFDITEEDGTTVLTFTHDGLTPHDECYDVCQDAWTNYIKTSLYNLITTGKGQPNSTGNPQTKGERTLGSTAGQ